MDPEIAPEIQEVTERLRRAVGQVMSLAGVSSEGAGDGFVVRFEGRLLIEPEEAYDRLEGVFKEEGTTLVFREEANQHVILAVTGLIQPKPSNPWVNLVMFILTLLSVVFTGVLTAAGYNTTGDPHAQSVSIIRDLPLGIVFAVSILAILGSHEFGHYLAARFHNTAVTLPYFIPFPGSPFGTLGAFIQLKQPPRNKRVLMDIGLAGPIAGFVIAIPVLLIGLSLSEVGNLPLTAAEAVGQGLEGNSLLYLALKYLITGEVLPAPLDYGGVDPLVYWGRYLLLGLPVPFGGRDVMLHPMAWAGWAGLLITALNLIPAGQLDGGHTIYVLLGRRAAMLWPFIVVTLVIMGVVWPGWWFWAALIFFLGRTYAQPLDEITPLDRRRKVVAILGLILFVLVFTPVPLRSF